MVAKGFKKRYFSLAAIAATVSAVALNAQAAQIAQIEKVVVSATKFEEPLGEVTDDVTIISAEDIEEQGLKTLKEALEYVSGVNVVSNGGVGKATSLYLRGLPNDKVLILIDGVRYNDPSNISGPSIEHLLLTNVERIEIIKGAQSGIWGSDAASGVINIVTSKERTKRASALVGSFATKNIEGIYTDRQGNLFYSLALHYYDTNGFSAITPYNEDPTDFEADGYTNKSGQLKLGYLFEGGHIETGVHLIDAENEADGYNPQTYAPDPNSKNDDEFKYYAYYLNSTYYLASHTLSLHADTTKTERKFLDTTWGVNRFEGKTSNIELKDRFDYAYGVLQGGIGYQNFKSEYSEVGGKSGDVSYDNGYAYLTNKNRFGDLLVTENIRYDDFDKFNNQWTGKVGLKYTFKEGALFANWGRAYNVPNQIKMINPWGVSNFNLDPEKTTSWDIGFEAYGFKAVYFEERVKDLINWFDPNPDNWGDEYYTNFDGTSKFKGVELNYQQALSDTIYVKVGFTYLDPKDANGNYIPRRAKTKYSYSFSWYPTDDHTINIDGYYVGKRWDDAAKRIKTGSYNVTNLTASHRFAKRFKGYVQVKNIFDRRYQEVYGYGSTPRSYYVGIEASF